MLTRRERLMATLQGRPVDRPAVNFYEIGKSKVDRSDPSPFNIFNSPDWAPLLELAEEESDLIRITSPARTVLYPDLYASVVSSEKYDRDGSRYFRTSYRVAGNKTLSTLTRQDPGVNTTWTLEHLCKSPEDLEAFIELPDELFARVLDTAPMEAADRDVGDRGIVMVDTGDSLGRIAGLFSMEDFTVIALTERELFHRLLGKFAGHLEKEVEELASRFPNHLWRFCGPEYATEPYLPPSLFNEYVVRYATPVVRTIQRHGGYVRIHCHGRLKKVLGLIAGMGVDALDPIEPPPQGDVELAEVRREHGGQLVLFGNLEASDIENLPPRDFEKKVHKALKEGTAGEGRGFVLMPSASPYGRTITPHTLENYRTMIRLATTWPG